MASLMNAADYYRGGLAAAPALARPIGEPSQLAVQAYSVHNINDPLLREFLAGGLSSAAGITVNDKVALRNSAFFRSVALIAGSIGMLPTHLMWQDEDGQNKRKAREHSLFRLLHRRPNRYQTAGEFKSALQTFALLDGNAYAYVIRSGRKFSQLVPFERGTIEPELTDNFELRFKYQPRNGGTRYFSQRDVFHFRHPITIDGIKGVALKEMARETIGVAAVAAKAAAKLFRHGSFAQGVLETDKVLGDDVHGRLSNDWAEIYSGIESSGKWPILEQGLKARALSPNAKESQHLETREHEAEEVARFTGVPRPLLMFDETSWGSGIEQLGQFFVTYCLSPWFTAWEQAIARILEPAEEDHYYAKFNEGALLRGSLKDQAEFFAKALGSGGSDGWLTANEVREQFDRNPRDDGGRLPTRAAAQS